MDVATLPCTPACETMVINPCMVKLIDAKGLSVELTQKDDSKQCISSYTSINDFIEIKRMWGWHWSTKYTYKVASVITQHPSRITILIYISICSRNFSKL